MFNYRIKRELQKVPVIYSILGILNYFFKKRNFLIKIIFDLIITSNQHHFLRNIKINQKS